MIPSSRSSRSSDLRVGRFLIAFALSACGGDAPQRGSEDPPPLAVRVVTFNTGTTDALAATPETNRGYGPIQAEIADRWYGNGLAWNAAIEDARRFLTALQPDIVGFQEIFHPVDCSEIPAEYHAGFVCEQWRSGDPTVAQTVVGPGYQVACHRGKSDKCLAVRNAFGSIRGCDGPLCLDGLAGADIAGCGSGSRVGRAVIDRADGQTLTVVHVHGTSGFTASDRSCRMAQFAQVFADLGDGSGRPAAEGTPSIVLGDFNTDPIRTARGDASAAALAAYASTPSPFRFINDVGFDAAPTYFGSFNIDHVLAAGLSGTCWAAGISPDRPPVTDMTYFDHTAIVCDLEAQRLGAPPHIAHP